MNALERLTQAEICYLDRVYPGQSVALAVLFGDKPEDLVHKGRYTWTKAGHVKESFSDLRKAGFEPLEILEYFSGYRLIRVYSLSIYK